jgi:hypothetical protein
MSVREELKETLIAAAALVFENNLAIRIQNPNIDFIIVKTITNAEFIGLSPGESDLVPKLCRYTVTFHTPYMYGNVNENKNPVGSVIKKTVFLRYYIVHSIKFVLKIKCCRHDTTLYEDTKLSFVYEEANLVW